MKSKKRSFKEQQERHKKRQALWDGVKRLREGQEAVLTVSGKRVALRPYDYDAIQEAIDCGNRVYYLVRVGVKALVLAQIHGNKIVDVLVGNEQALNYRFRQNAVLGFCAVKI